jgi:hypothetical protein
MCCLSQYEPKANREQSPKPAQEGGEGKQKGRVFNNHFISFSSRWAFMAQAYHGCRVGAFGKPMTNLGLIRNSLNLRMVLLNIVQVPFNL